MTCLKRLSLLLCLSLFLAACGADAPLPESTLPLPETTLPAQAAPIPEDALSAFRAEMLPPVVAVADFGFPELSEDFDAMAYLRREYPRWLEERDFVRNIPEDRIIRTCGYDRDALLLCIVPRDPQSSVNVRVMRYMDVSPYMREDVVYQSETGEPILLLAEIGEDIQVSLDVIDSQGRGVSWVPCFGSFLPIPEEGYPGALVMDFTPAFEYSGDDSPGDTLSPYDFALTQGWSPPEPQQLINSFWLSYLDYGLELLEDGVPGDAGGAAILYDVGPIGEYIQSHSGSWQLESEMLHLMLVPQTGEGWFVDDSFPVLILGDQLWLGRNDRGEGLPQFPDDLLRDLLEQPKG